jgi:hypothetical protein
MQITIKCNISKNLFFLQDIKKPSIKNHLGHTWYGFKTYRPFPLIIFASSNSFCVFWFDWMETMFCRYECGYGPKDHREDPNHMKSIKRGCMTHFSIKRLYTCQDVVEIIFYHQIHTRPMGILLIVHVTQGPHHRCRHMLHTCLRSWRSLYGPN